MSVRAYCILIICSLFSGSTLAETYVREYTHKALENDTKESSRVIAIDQIKMLLLQEVGTYIVQKISITKDGSGNSFMREETDAVTAGLTKLDILDESWDGFTYYLKARIEIDPQRVTDFLEEYKKTNSEESKQQLELLKDNMRKLKAARKEVAQLKSKLNQVTSNVDKEKIVTQYNKEVKKISLSNIFERGFNYGQQGLFDDSAYWYRKAAEQGHAVSQSNLGFLYEKGRGVKQDDKLAAYWFRKAAEQGLAAAQNNLGIMYQQGYGVMQDDELAAYWYRKAAEQGHAVSQSNLGFLYEKGRGVKQNYELAVHWYRKSAERGHAEGQSNLGAMYQRGYGIKQDDELAVYWYRKAAEQGYAAGQVNLGSMYALGHGVKHDLTQMSNWYRKAAEQGLMAGQYNVGVMYDKGYGVEQDYSKSVYWFRKAAEQGSKEAEQYLKKLGASVTK